MKKFYVNGSVLTMEQDALYAEAVCVEDGRIRAVGTNEEVMALWEQEDQVMDLEGRTMLPGFLDGHSHFAGTANAMLQCDLSACESFQDIVAAMQEFRKARQLKEEDWLVGCNYDHNFLQEGRHPDRTVLDQIGGGNPVLLIHASSHMGVTNSKGLLLQGITEETEDLPDGRYGREHGSRQPNGYMEEQAFLQFQAKLPMPSFTQLMELMKEAQQLYASYGITTVQDGMVAEPLFQLLKAASDQGILQLDVVGYVDILTAKELQRQYPEYRGRYQKHLKLGGYKIFLDGSPQGKTAWMKQPYEGESTYCGYPIHKNEVVLDCIHTAMEREEQLLAHCNGDAAAEQYVTLFEQVLKERGKSDCHRAVMVHAQLVQKEQLHRMKRIGMIPSFFIAHTYYWGDIHLKNFGITRGNRISPARDAMEEGMCFTFHQDTPVVPPDMMRTISCAVNRMSKSGVQIGREQCIPVLEALKAITCYAAYQYGEEVIKGTIAAGKYADLVVLDQDPLKTEPELLSEIQVLMTIKEGEVCWKNSNF